MTPRRIAAEDLASVLPKGGRVLVQGTTGESHLFADAVMAAGDSLGAMTFTGIFIPGVNTRHYCVNKNSRVETFFVTPHMKPVMEQVDFLPLCYADIRARLSSVAIDAAIFMCSPPDDNGDCSFGPAVDFLAELWPRIPVRIAHINPLMPRTRGHKGIPFDRITAFVEAEQAFDTSPDTAEDPIANAIAAHIAPMVPDGACLQTGVGKVPGAVLRALTGRRGLKIHSGLIVDEVVDLLNAGALANGASVVAGVAIGSRRLYEAISGPTFSFQPVSITHGATEIAAIPNFISINSALEVDLLGQVYAEVGPKGIMSGPGGASEYARAVRHSVGGLRIIALPASAARGAVSRIVPPAKGKGPVSLGRMDVDIIVTEFGATDVRCKSYAERAAALIAIAPPEHRDHLQGEWDAFARQL